MLSSGKMQIYVMKVIHLQAGASWKVVGSTPGSYKGFFSLKNFMKMYNQFGRERFKQFMEFMKQMGTQDAE